jgi:hypothetical protein
MKYERRRTRLKAPTAPTWCVLCCCLEGAPTFWLEPSSIEHSSSIRYILIRSSRNKRLMPLSMKLRRSGYGQSQSDECEMAALVDCQ